MMIVDITNEIYTILKQNIGSATVLSSYPDITPTFPCIIIEEISNTDNYDSVDSGGSNHSAVSLEINIFSNAQNKITEAKNLRNQVDAILSDTYGMTRNYSGTIPNFTDASLYRYVMRYSFLVDENRTIYRR